MSSQLTSDVTILVQPLPQSFNEYVSYEYDENSLLPKWKTIEFFNDLDDDEEKYLPFEGYMPYSRAEIWLFYQRQGNDVTRISEWNPYVLPPSLTNELSSSLPRDAYNLLPDLTQPPSLITEDQSIFGKLIDYNRNEVETETLN